MIHYLKRLFIPQSPVLGRWALKHNTQKCENYVQNYYAEPGYPNNLKKDWQEKIIVDSRVTSGK